MDEVGVFEARNSLSSLIDRVEKGEEITITRNGKPVARLVAAASDRDVERARKAADRIRALRESLPAKSLEGLSIRQLIEEGRRY
jgi:prevent-host-death family protein